MPSYGSTPTRETVAGTYPFLRWEPEITSVTTNATYTAVWDEIIPKKYTITFALKEGVIFSSTEYNYGTNPDNIIRPTDLEIIEKTDKNMRFVKDGQTVNFSGWPQIETVTENKTYYAQSSGINGIFPNKLFAFSGIETGFVYTKTLAEGDVQLYNSLENHLAYQYSRLIYIDGIIYLKTRSGNGFEGTGRRDPANDWFCR